MEYGKLLSRSASIVWQNKFLIVLGFLASLGSGSFGGGGGDGATFDSSTAPLEDEFAALAAGLVVAIVCVALFVAIVLWVISTIARGGMIASVDDIESGQKSKFTQAWSAGWKRGWSLLGIGIIPAIPGMIFFVIALVALGAYGGIFALFGRELSNIFGGVGIGVTVFALLCIILPIALVLSILRHFAERACMLEDLGVVDSYRRGTRVLVDNLGQAIVLFIIQLAIYFGLFIVLFIPAIFVALCCFLWPLFLVVQGAISAWASAIWTLAWRTWTGRPTMVEKQPAAI